MGALTDEIAVCILFFEKLELTKKCIESFISSGINIYILNNNSSVKSSQKLTNYCTKYSQIKIFSSTVNLGPAGGRNFLINNTTERWLVFVDNDIHLKTKDWISRLEAHLNTYPDELVFIPRLYNYHDREFASFNSFELNDRVVNEKKPEGNTINCFPGGASIINRKMFTKYGLYNHELYAFEDYEYAIRSLVNNNPLTAILIDDIVFEHRHVYHHRKEDKYAVYERYNSSRLNDAIKTIEESHKVAFQHYWEWWVNQQIFLMTKSTPLNKIKNYLYSFWKKQL